MTYGSVVLPDSPYAFIEEFPTIQGSGATSWTQQSASNPEGLENNCLSLIYSGTSYGYFANYAVNVPAGTFELWFKTTTSAADSRMMYYRNSTFVVSIGHYNGVVTANIGNLSPGPSTFADTKTTNDDEWHHVALTWSGYDTVKLYVDGEEVAGGTISTLAGTGSGSSRIWFGTSGTNTKDSNVNGRAFGGLIDNIAVYPTALSSTRIGVHSAYFSGGAPMVVDVGIADRAIASGIMATIRYGIKLDVEPGVATFSGMGVTTDWVFNIEKASIALIGVGATISKGTQLEYSEWGEGNFLYLPGDGTHNVPAQTPYDLAALAIQYPKAGIKGTELLTGYKEVVDHSEGRFGLAYDFNKPEHHVTLHKVEQLYPFRPTASVADFGPSSLEIEEWFPDANSDGYIDGWGVDLWFRSPGPQSHKQYLVFKGSISQFNVGGFDGGVKPDFQIAIEPDGTLTVNNRLFSNIYDDVSPSHLETQTRTKRVNNPDGSWTDVEYEVQVPVREFVADNQWHHIAFSHDTLAKREYVWLDGVPQYRYEIDSRFPTKDTYIVSQLGRFTGTYYTHGYRIGEWWFGNIGAWGIRPFFYYRNPVKPFSDYKTFSTWRPENALFYGPSQTGHIDDGPSDPNWTGLGYSPVDFDEEMTTAYNFVGQMDEIIVKDTPLSHDEVQGRFRMSSDQSLSYKVAPDRLQAYGRMATIEFGPLGPKSINVGVGTAVAAGRECTMFLRTPLDPPMFLEVPVGTLSVGGYETPELDKVLIPVINYRLAPGRSIWTGVSATLDLLAPAADARWTMRLRMPNKTLTTTVSGR